MRCSVAGRPSASAGPPDVRRIAWPPRRGGRSQGHAARRVLLAGACLCATAAQAAHVRADEPEGIEVTVQESRRGLAPSGRDPSVASTVRRAEDLGAPGSSAAEALARVPGVQTSMAGAGADLATASIRGATSAQTPVYLAGVRLNDDVTGTADLSLVPLWMIQRVEVFRGNAPRDADRLGIGGAIFFEPVLPSRPRIGGGFGAGSFGQMAAWGSGSAGDERARAMVALRHETAENDYPYVDDRGTSFDTSDDRVSYRKNADHVASDLWSIGRLRLGRASITMITNAFTRDQGVTGFAVVPARAARSHVQRWLGAVSAQVPCGGADGGGGDRCRLELISSAISSDNRISDPLREIALLTTMVESSGQRISEVARLHYDMGDAVELGAHASYESERLGIDAAGGEPLRAGRLVSRAGAFVSADITDRLQLNGLTTVECHTTSGAARSEACGVLEPLGRVGARLTLPLGVSLLANVGRYVRVPTLGETYGISAAVRGNPDLGAERGVTADLGARFSTEDVYLDVFGFTRFAADLIAFRRSSFGAARPFNVGSARLAGLEVAAGATVLRAIRAEAALTALDPRDTTEGRGTSNDILPFQSRLVAAPSVEIYQEDLQRVPIDRISFGARFLYRTSRVADLAGLVVLPEQSSLDLELAVLLWQKRVAGRLRVANVLDTRNLDTIGLPLPGRSFHGSMEVWSW
ncbi:MAG: TonB-dependent receptor [Polyangiaceae bacterium]|nr:TonB-dependent receptor [Polyangiaceae bacterium]